MQLLSPAGGESFRTGDTVRVITRCDYSKFSSGINIAVSLDSGVVWDLVCSRPRLSGVANDTFAWTPGQDYSDSALVGSGVLVKISDYNKAFSVLSGMFFFVHN
jgi:hypothetical protein